MKLIYQIGRYDKNYLLSLNFVINQKNYESPLSSICLKQIFSDAKLSLIYPVSIVYNNIANELKDKDNFSKIIVERINNYLDKPLEVIKEHPHNKYADDFFVIHSLGSYKFNDIEIEFKASYDDIVLELLCDMLKKYLKFKDYENEVYVDISSGHNIYVCALIEALKHLFVFSCLLNWQNKNKRVKTYIVFSDPILGSLVNEFHIYIQQIEFKSFFSSPTKNEDININFGNRLSKKIYSEENKEKRKKLDELLENFGIVFSAIKNNTPLVLYHFGYDEYNNIIKDLTDLVCELKNKLMSKSWQESPCISKNVYLKLILSLGLYAGIIEVLEKNNVRQYKLDEGIKLSEIKEKFASKDNSIYKIFNLGSLVHHLGQETYNLYEGKDENKKTLIEKLSDKWEKLNKYLSGKEQNFVDRNFFAHTGFERNVTEVRKKDNEIYLRYAKEKENEIKNVMIKYIG